MVASISTIDTSTYLKWFNYLSAGFVQASNSFVACKSETFIKQVDTRLSKFSGLFDLVFTGVYGYFMQDVNIYTAFNNILDNTVSTTCYLSA